MYGFDIVCKIVDNEKVLGYKIQHTFSVLYVTPEVLEEGVEQNLIFPFPNVWMFEYEDIGMKRGRTGQERFKQAIKETTLDDLKEAKEHNQKYEVIMMEITELNKVIRKYRLVPEKDIIYPLYNRRKQLLKTRFETIYDLVDFIVSVKDKEYKNIKDIIEYIDNDKTESSNVYSFKVEIE